MHSKTVFIGQTLKEVALNYKRKPITASVAVCIKQKKKLKFVINGREKLTYFV